MLLEMKKYARYNWIPIILDDSLEFIKDILIKQKPEKILEIGTAIGYSSAIFSEYLRVGGKIDTLEISHKAVLLAQANHKMLGVDDRINIIEGDALKILPTLSEKYDVIFIDGPKSHYIQYLPYCLELLNEKGIIIADNVIYKGMVLSDYNDHKQRTAVTKLREFIEKVENDKTLESHLYDIGDGVMTIRRK